MIAEWIIEHHKLLLWIALGLLGVREVAIRWQAAGVEVERQRANRNPMVRKDDR